jgi:hypothetical protein
MATLGVAAGAVLAAGLARIAGGMLFGVSAYDLADLRRTAGVGWLWRLQRRTLRHAAAPRSIVDSLR